MSNGKRKRLHSVFPIHLIYFKIIPLNLCQLILFSSKQREDPFFGVPLGKRQPFDIFLDLILSKPTDSSFV